MVSGVRLESKETEKKVKDLVMKKCKRVATREICEEKKRGIGVSEGDEV